MGWLQNASQGLGRVRNALLPVPEEVANQLDPRTIETLRKQAMLQMGLGMVAAGEKGQGIGAGAMYGLNQAQQGLGQGLNQAWVGSRSAREDKRLEQYDRRLDIQEKKADEDRKWQKDKYAEEQAWRQTQAEAEAARAAVDDARHAAQLGISQGHLGLAQRSAGVSAMSEEAQQRAAQAKQKADQAAILAGQTLAKYPNHPRAAELKGYYKTFTGREWDPKTGLSDLEQEIAGLGGLSQTPGTPTAPVTATNPKTGEKLQLVNGQWVPVGGK